MNGVLCCVLFVNKTDLNFGQMARGATRRTLRAVRLMFWEARFKDDHWQVRSDADASSKLSATTGRFMLDSRAVVRRSAVALALRLLRDPAPPSALTNLKVPVAHIYKSMLHSFAFGPYVK